ncbi:GSCOCG00012849001-RA-CDS, partial [Cotesia congregata]
KVFGCEVCGRRYRRVISLQRHKRLECGKEAQFECIICHSKFKHKHSLLRHYRVHLSSTPTRLIQGKGGEHTRILSIYRRRDRPWPFLEPRLDLSPPTGVRTVDAST